MKTILFDSNKTRQNLLPLTYTRAICDIRVGISTIKEKWEKSLNRNIFVLSEDYLGLDNFSIENEEILFINGSFIPDNIMLNAINSLKINQFLLSNDNLLAVKIFIEKSSDNFFDYFQQNNFDNLEKVIFDKKLRQISELWDIFTLNAEILEEEIMAMPEIFEPEIFEGNTIIGQGKHKLVVEKGAKVVAATLNLSDASIYIGKNAEIMEGTCIRGGLALCEHSVLKMGSKIYGATTIGPNCKIGGEISNVVFQGYSNKAHDGFLGNSVIGEYCNFGAGSNASNLKNTYSEVKIWDIAKKTLKNTGQTFCGLIMGDYSRCAVQTAFNTACVVGIAANIFEKSEKNAKFFPSFSFGKDVAELDKTFQTIEKMKARRGQELTEREKNILRHIFKNI